MQTGVDVSRNSSGKQVHQMSVEEQMRSWGFPGKKEGKGECSKANKHMQWRQSQESRGRWEEDAEEAKDGTWSRTSPDRQLEDGGVGPEWDFANERVHMDGTKFENTLQVLGVAARKRRKW